MFTALPSCFAGQDFLANLQTQIKLALHHFQHGVGDVEGGVLLRVGRSNDGHYMEAVHHVVPRVTDGKAKPDQCLIIIHQRQTHY